MSDPIKYEKAKSEINYNLISVTDIKSKYFDAKTLSAKYDKTLHYKPSKNSSVVNIFKTNDEATIEIRFYSSETPNEAFRIGQKRCRGRIHNIERVDKNVNSGYILTFDSSAVQRRSINVITVDEDYLNSIQARSIIIYYYETPTSFVPNRRITIPVEHWLSSAVYINNNIIVETEDPEDKLQEFYIGDYVRIEYITNESLIHGNVDKYVANKSANTSSSASASNSYVTGYTLNARSTSPSSNTKKSNSSSNVGMPNSSTINIGMGNLVVGKETAGSNYQHWSEIDKLKQWEKINANVITGYDRSKNKFVNGRIIEINSDTIIYEEDGEDIEAEYYTFRLDTSLYHHYKTVSITSPCIASMTKLDPPKTIDLREEIKDPNFRREIRRELGLDIDNDDCVLSDYAVERIKNLDVSNCDISDLTGLKYLNGLLNFDCSHNNLESIDSAELKELRILQTFNCSYNNINALTLNKNTMLEYVDCRYNGIPESTIGYLNIEGLNLEIDKTVMYIPQKMYVTIDIIDPTIYEEIYKQLELPETYKLTTSDCELITSLNLDGSSFRGSNEPITEENRTKPAKIKTLKGLEYLNNLEELIVPHNEISELHPSFLNQNIRRIDISYNKLIYDRTMIEDGNIKTIDLTRNGRLYYFDCRYNFIEDESYISTPAFVLDENEEPVDTIPHFYFYPQIDNITPMFTDDNFRRVIKELLDLEFTDMILKSDLVDITELDISGKEIDNLDGIEYFVNLERLYCNYNNLTELMFSGDDENIKCPNLSWIECNHNNIKEIRLQNLKKLQYLDCSDNIELISFEMLDCIGIEKLIISNTALFHVTIDVSNGIGTYRNLLELDAQYSDLVNLHLDLFPELRNLYCNNNRLTYLDLSNNLQLQYLDCGFNELDELVLTNNTELLELKVNNNNLEELDLGKCLSLASADVRYNSIDDISYVTNASHVALSFYPQIENITKKFDSNLLSYIRTILHIGPNGRVYNYDCLSIEELDIHNKNISNLDVLLYFTNLKKIICYGNKLTKLDLSNCNQIEIIDCHDNQISELILDNVSELKELYCNNNKLDSVSIPNILKLEILDIRDNKITSIEINGTESNLKIFRCANNSIEELDISKLSQLEVLDCSYNKLLSLDTSSNILLSELYCNDNIIQNIELKGRIYLTKLNCSNNHIQELCFKSCLALESVNCSNNVLTELDLTGREKLKYLDCSYNAMVSIDKVYNRVETSGSTFIFNPQITDVTEEFTDINFRNEVRKLLGITVDTPIMYADCANITTLDISNKNIANLHGIEYFINLEELNCSYNVIWNMDVSKNILLTKLYCSYNYMVTLDDIKRLHNVLLDKNIDFTPQNLIITEYFTDQVFTKYIRGLLDIEDDEPIIDQQCLNITEVDVSGMEVHSLDGIEWLVNITYLDCSHNFLEEIDISKCINLQYIDCSYNHLQEIDIRNCLDIIYLYCSHNNMTNRDNVHASINMIEELSIFDFDDQNVIINDDFNDFLFKSKIISMNKFKHNDVLTDYVVSMITKLDLNGKDVEEDYKYKSLKGINWFVNLEELDCSYNILEELDVTGCTSLKKLNCSHNWIYEIYLDIHTHTDECKNDLGSITHCTCALESLDCSYNYLKALTVSYYSNLIELNCSNNHNSLNTLNMIKCPNLVKVDCSHNRLISLDCSGDTSLTQLYCNHNSISRLELQDCENLEELYCYNNQLTRLDISKCKALTYLQCYYNRIVSLDTTNNIRLTQLYCNNNQLIELIIHNNEYLEYVYCHYNNLIELDVEDCINILFLNCSYNAIRYITSVMNRPDTLVEEDNFIYEPQNSYE